MALLREPDRTGISRQRQVVIGIEPRRKTDDHIVPIDTLDHTFRNSSGSTRFYYAHPNLGVSGNPCRAYAQNLRSDLYARIDPGGCAIQRGIGSKCINKSNRPDCGGRLENALAGHRDSPRTADQHMIATDQPPLVTSHNVLSQQTQCAHFIHAWNVDFNPTQ